MAAGEIDMAIAARTGAAMQLGFWIRIMNKKTLSDSRDSVKAPRIAKVGLFEIALRHPRFPYLRLGKQKASFTA
jgi:hypothetical protein